MLTEEMVDQSLSYYVRVIGKDGEMFEAFLVRPDFVVCFDTAPNREFRVIEFYRVAATDDPKVYRVEDHLCWHSPRIMVRFDMVVNQLPESIVDVASLSLLDFMLIYTTDYAEKYLTEKGVSNE